VRLKRPMRPLRGSVRLKRPLGGMCALSALWLDWTQSCPN
jgi:hypothetical protein